jgi:synaptobrevin family protein YKT6
MSVRPLHFLAAYGTHAVTPILVASAEELTNYSRWVRGTVREFLHFTARTLASKTEPGAYLILALDKYPFIAYSHHRNDGLVTVLITAQDYPEDCARRVLDRASTVRYTDACWMLESRDVKEPCSVFQNLLAHYQDPLKTDPIKNVQAKITDVKAAARVNIEKLIARGETIEVLVARSGDLSDASKKFYDKADDLNSCCWRWFGWKRRSGGK